MYTIHVAKNSLIYIKYIIYWNFDNNDVTGLVCYRHNQIMITITISCGITSNSINNGRIIEL